MRNVTLCRHGADPNIFVLFVDAAVLDVTQSMNNPDLPTGERMF